MAGVFINSSKKRLILKNNITNYNKCIFRSHNYWSQFRNSFKPKDIHYKTHRNFTLCGFASFIEWLEPSNTIDVSIIEDKEYNLVKKEEKLVGFPAVKRIFTYDHYGLPRAEYAFIMQGSFTAFFGGFAIGAGLEGMSAYIDFVKNNKATQFESTFHAQRKLFDRIFMAVIRGGINYSVKFGFFTSSLILMHSCLTVYQGKESLLGFVAAGTCTGALVRFHKGPKPSVMGGIAGAIVGLIGGMAITTFCYICGVTLDDLKKEQYNQMVKGKSDKLKVMKQDRDKDSERAGDMDAIVMLSAIDDKVEKRIKELYSKEDVVDSTPIID